MSLAKKKIKIVQIPLTVFETAESKDDLEDWLLSNDKSFIKRMRDARAKDLKSEGKPWSQLRAGLFIKCVEMKNKIQKKLWDEANGDLKKLNNLINKKAEKSDMWKKHTAYNKKAA